MKLYDISPSISSDLAVFPGDQKFEQSFSMSFSHGHHLALSSMKSTMHIGAHADAPSHYHPEGLTIDKVDLKTYFGSAQVIDLTQKLQPKSRILPKDIESVDISSERILFKTGSFSKVNQWIDTFNSLSPEVINTLAQKGVLLVGIDTPSIDPSDSKDLPSHSAAYTSKMALLEGLDLSAVSEGKYTLIALPLKIKNAEASPVRAVLIKEDF